jgi:hypothetical protein
MWDKSRKDAQQRAVNNAQQTVESVKKKKDPRILLSILPGEMRSPSGMTETPSVITLKPAIRYHFKTGQRKWPKT